MACYTDKLEDRKALVGGFYHEFSWKIERIGWMVLALVVGFAIVGLFGGGPVSLRKASSENGNLTLQYERFWRNGASTELEAHIKAVSEGQPFVRLNISQDYLDRVEVQQITPAPTRVSASAGFQQYEFALAPGATEALIKITLQCERFGSFSGFIENADGGKITFRQLFYP